MFYSFGKYYFALSLVVLKISLLPTRVLMSWREDGGLWLGWGRSRLPLNLYCNWQIALILQNGVQTCKTGLSLQLTAELMLFGIKQLVPYYKRMPDSPFQSFSDSHFSVRVRAADEVLLLFQTEQQLEISKDIKNERVGLAEMCLHLYTRGHAPFPPCLIANCRSFIEAHPRKCFFKLI